MKQFNRFLFYIIFLWIIISLLAAAALSRISDSRTEGDYLVEINRIMDAFCRKDAYYEPEYSNFHFIQKVEYYPLEASIEKGNEMTKPDRERLDNFYNGKGIKGKNHFTIRPLVLNNKLAGFIRFTYTYRYNSHLYRVTFFIEGIIFIIFLLLFSFLFFTKNYILKPFHRMEEMPYELSKGHITADIKESKNRYFARFLWGLSLLKENLEEHKRKELQLEKDKKLMILSLSHDVKTPLSTIKLYTKALYEELYESEEKKHNAAKLIEEKADQIEKIISDIMKTSSTELFDFEVISDDFYLSKLVNRIRHSYEEKFVLLKTDFRISSYTDKLVKGDYEKLIEVFDNLLQNAVKYGDGKEIILSFEEQDNCQLIKVKNSGKPLVSSDFVHMFESFWRGSNAYDKTGNGLGLYICKQLLLKMNGEIYAEAGDYEMSLVVVLQKS